MKRSVLFTLLLAALTGCGHDRHDAPETSFAIKPVQVAPVVRVPAEDSEEFMGTVTARSHADIEAKVQARVERVAVKLGSRVASGDLLAELDRREFAARAEQARALYDQAARDLERFQKLFKEQAATSQEYDGAVARKAVAEAALAEAEAFLSYTRIVAPFAGRVTKKLTDVGDLALPGRALFTLEEDGALRFVVGLPESKMGEVSVGDSLAVLVASLQAPVRGRVEELSPATDPVSRTFVAKISLPSMPGVRPGQFGRLLLAARGDETMFIPRAALVRRGQLDLVYVVGPDRRARLRLVRIGRQMPDKLEILSGLREGEEVVAEGWRDLVDGDSVEVAS
jgi:RND family efflux transporter MFP subunit